MSGYPGVRNYPLYAPAVYKAAGVDVKTVSGAAALSVADES